MHAVLSLFVSTIPIIASGSNSDVACPPLTFWEARTPKSSRQRRSDAFDAEVRTKYIKAKGSNPGRIVNVFFTRHAESDENAFNVRRMATDLVSDARLSQKGVSQAMQLADYVSSKGPNCQQDPDFWKDQQTQLGNIHPSNDCRIAAFLRGESDRPVMIATSSLSRAILTGVIGYRSRIANLDPRNPATGRVHMLSLLEEATSGWTSQMSVGACEFPKLYGNLSFSVMVRYRELREQARKREAEAIDSEYFEKIKNRFDLRGAQLDRNVVPKHGKFWSSEVPQANKDKRFLDFCHWAMSEASVNDVIVTGHSNWVREFLMSRIAGPMNEVEGFLTQVEPKVKLGNAGVLAFQIYYDEHAGCSVVGGSTEFVFGYLSVDKKNKGSRRIVPGPAPAGRTPTELVNRSAGKKEEVAKNTNKYYLSWIILICIFFN